MSDSSALTVHDVATEQPTQNTTLKGTAMIEGTTLCGLCDEELRGPFSIFKSEKRQTIICRTCMAEFRELFEHPLLSQQAAGYRHLMHK
jgi:hypothetical protein